MDSPKIDFPKLDDAYEFTLFWIKLRKMAPSVEKHVKCLRAVFGSGSEQIQIVNYT